jgi:hypothetical protein
MEYDSRTMRRSHKEHEMNDFKKELAELLRKHSVEMSVVEDDSGYARGYAPYAKGISFWSYTQYDTNGNVVREAIDFEVGRTATWEDFVE